MALKNRYSERNRRVLLLGRQHERNSYVQPSLQLILVYAAGRICTRRPPGVPNHGNTRNYISADLPNLIMKSIVGLDLKRTIYYSVRANKGVWLRFYKKNAVPRLSEKNEKTVVFQQGKRTVFFHTCSQNEAIRYRYICKHRWSSESVVAHHSTAINFNIQCFLA